MMTEPEILDLLSDYLDGSLDKPTRSAVEEGLRRYPVARRTLEELRSTVNLLAALPRTRPPADFSDRAAAAARKLVVLGAAGRETLNRTARRTFWSPILSMAAVLALCSLLTVVVWQAQRQFQEPRQAGERVAVAKVEAPAERSAMPAPGDGAEGVAAAVTPAPRPDAAPDREANNADKPAEPTLLRQQQSTAADPIDLLKARRAANALQSAENRRKLAASAPAPGFGGGAGGAAASSPSAPAAARALDRAEKEVSAPVLDTFAGTVMIRGRQDEVYDALVEALAKLEKKGSLKWSPPAADLPAGQLPSFTLTTDDPSEIEAVFALLPRSPAVKKVELVPSPVCREAFAEASAAVYRRGEDQAKGNAEQVLADGLLRAEKAAAEFDRLRDARHDGKGDAVAKADGKYKAVDPGQAGQAKPEDPQQRGRGVPGPAGKPEAGAANNVAPAKSAEVGGGGRNESAGGSPKTVAPAIARAKSDPKNDPQAGSNGNTPKATATARPGPDAKPAEAERALALGSPKAPAEKPAAVWAGKALEDKSANAGADRDKAAAVFAPGALAARPGETAQQREIRLQAAVVVAQIRALHVAVDPNAVERLKKLKQAAAAQRPGEAKGGGALRENADARADDEHRKTGSPEGRAEPSAKAPARPAPTADAAAVPTDRKVGKDQNAVRRTITLVLTLQAEPGK